MEDTLKILFGKIKSKIPLERSSCRWQDNIRMDFEEVGIE